MICAQTLDLQAHVVKACDKWDCEWPSCIHARFENVKDLHVIDVIYHISSRKFTAHMYIPQQSCLRFIWKMKRLKSCLNPDSQKICVQCKMTTTTTTTKPTTTTMTTTLTTTTTTTVVMVMVIMAMVMVMVIVAVVAMMMSVNCWVNIYMKSKLKEHLGDGIVITELLCERNVVTFCLTVASVIFLYYCSLNQPQNCTADYGKINIIGTAAIFLLKVMWKQWHLMYHCVSAQRMCYPQLYHTYLIL